MAWAYNKELKILSDAQEAKLDYMQARALRKVEEITGVDTGMLPQENANYTELPELDRSISSASAVHSLDNIPIHQGDCDW